jgi:hypothetical protein
MNTFMNSSTCVLGGQTKDGVLSRKCSRGNHGGRFGFGQTPINFAARSAGKGALIQSQCLDCRFINGSGNLQAVIALEIREGRSRFKA